MNKPSILNHEHSPMLHADHPLPTTRRALMAQGFVGGASALMGPSLLGMLGGRASSAYAQAADCGMMNAAGSAQNMSVLMFDLVGGGSLCGSNICVGRAEDQTDTRHFRESGWVSLGLPSEYRYNANGDNVDRTIGLPFVSSSPILAGIKSRASASTLAKTNGTVFCARSANDTANNMLNPSYALARAGIGGTVVPLVGTEANDYGGNSVGPYYNPGFRPTTAASPDQARSLSDIEAILDIMGSEPENIGALSQAIENLSRRRNQKIDETALARQLLDCQYQKTTAILKASQGGDEFDPRLDANITAAFGSNLESEHLARSATAAKLVIDGSAGAGTVALSGYDYHDGTRLTGDTRDFEFGESVGAALEYAALKGQPLMIYAFSDGSVTASPRVDGTGKFIWSADLDSTAGTVIISYNPVARDTYANHQIGEFSEFGEGTTEEIFSTNHQALCDIVALNYLALNGRINDFASAFPTSPILQNDWQRYVGLQI